VAAPSPSTKLGLKLKAAAADAVAVPEAVVVVVDVLEAAGAVAIAAVVAIVTAEDAVRAGKSFRSKYQVETQYAASLVVKRSWLANAHSIGSSIETQHAASLSLLFLVRHYRSALLPWRTHQEYQRKHAKEDHRQ
jgi:hypothetical protein